MRERDGWAGFFGTVALTAVLLAGGMALTAGYLIGHFSNPKEKTTTVAKAGLPGIPLGGTGTVAPLASAPATTPDTAPPPTQTETSPTAPTQTSTAQAKKPTPAEPSTGKTPDAAGLQVFAANCASCHTLAAAKAKGTVGPNLDQLKADAKTVANQVVNGGGSMPAFGKNKILTSEQIQMVAAYVAKVAGE
jgi:mono/diheme cytochrome c family protein